MMNHADGESGSRLVGDEWKEGVNPAAVGVQPAFGPGLQESEYEPGFGHPFDPRASRFDRQVRLPVEHKGVKLVCGYRLDLLVERDETSRKVQ